VGVRTHPVGANGIVLLCGRSFSGKSTLASELEQRLGAVLVSLDDINAERGFQSGAGAPVEEWVRTHEISRSRTRSALSATKSVIVDDTSSPRFLRDGWRKFAQELLVPLVLVYVDTPVERSLSRHAANRADGHRMDVTDEILHEHLDSFEVPAPDEDPVWYGADEGDFDLLVHEIESRLSDRDTSQ
jgi:predicted kinase